MRPPRACRFWQASCTLPPLIHGRDRFSFVSTTYLPHRAHVQRPCVSAADTEGTSEPPTWTEDARLPRSLEEEARDGEEMASSWDTVGHNLIGEVEDPPAMAAPSAKASSPHDGEGAARVGAAAGHRSTHTRSGTHTPTASKLHQYAVQYVPRGRWAATVPFGVRPVARSSLFVFSRPSLHGWA